MLFQLLMGSCQREDPEPDKPKGTLQVNIGLFISVNEVSSYLKSTLGTEDFKVVIFTAAGKEVLAYERASEMPASIELEAGDYYVAAYSKNNLPAAFANPYYYGESELFSLDAGSTRIVSVNCELANVMVSVIFSENLKKNFTNLSCSVSSSEGSLVFSREETRAGYFKPLPLSITATLTREKSDGSSEIKTLSGSIAAPQPKKHYEIHIDASVAGTAAVFDIRLDETSGQVQIVKISDSNDPPVSGELGNGDLLIAEIMYDPSSLSDAEGEWFEIYNNTTRSVDLQNLVITKNDTEDHIIKGPLILASHGYCILARTDKAVPGNKYVYNTDITLNNTGCVLSIRNYGTNGSDGSAICTVDYGSVGFPNASGASLNLDPDKLTIANVVSGNSWCISKTAYATGDLGTPGVINDQCN